MRIETLSLFMRSLAILIGVIAGLASECLLARGNELGSRKGVAFYEVKSVSGDVWRRAPFDYRWYPVEANFRIPEGHLLQTWDGARVKLLYHPAVGAKAGLEGDLTLTIVDPIVIRLQQGILRQIALTRYFSETLPVLSQLQMQQPKQGFSLRDAWAKVSALGLGGGGKIPGAGKKNQTYKDGVESSIAQQKIKILVPHDPLVVHSTFFPTTVTVRWKPITDKKAHYLVYLWGASKARPSPVGEGRFDRYQLNIPAPGEYLIQVTSLDGVWQSQAQHITVVFDSGSAMANQAEKRSESASNKTLLQLVYPTDNHQILVTQESIEETFRWDDLVDAQNVTYEFILREGRGEKEWRTRTKEPFTRQKLKIGTYIWSVEASIRNDIRTDQQSFVGTSVTDASQNVNADVKQALLFRSEARKISVHHGGSEKERISILSDFLSREKSGALYLTDGL